MKKVTYQIFMSLMVFACLSGVTHAQMRLWSGAFGHNERIPQRYTGEAEDLSPPLEWDSIPQEAVELALLVDDPDAPQAEPWTHWIVYKIPVRAKALPEGISPAFSVPGLIGALQGKNSWGTIGYRGPLPPKGHGLHHYNFTLYALRRGVAAKTGISRSEFLAAIKGTVLEETKLVGVYQR